MEESKLTVTVTEAGRLLGVSRNSAYALVSRGEIPSIRLGKRLIIPRKQLDELLAGNWPRSSDGGDKTQTL